VIVALLMATATESEISHDQYILLIVIKLQQGQTEVATKTSANLNFRILITLLRFTQF